MKREIKFRAWDKIEKKMMDWFFVHSEKGGVWEQDGMDKMIKYPEDRFILMQFTGGLDKDGIEIYENDYLEIPEVSDNSKTWCVFWGSGKYILQNISTGDILDCNETNTNKKEGGGNRYENPREHKAVASDL